MILKMRKMFFLMGIFLLFLIPLSVKNSNENLSKINDTNSINPTLLEGSVADPNSAIIEEIHQEQIRGSSLVRYFIRGWLGNTGDSVTAGTYTISARQINFYDDFSGSPYYYALHLMCDGYYDGVSDSILDNSFWESDTVAPVKDGLAYYHLQFTIGCLDYRYLAPSVYGDDYMEYDKRLSSYIAWSYYNNNGQYQINENPITLHIGMTYHFEPIIDIDDDYYNIQNVRCEVYNLYVEGHTFSGWTWEEQPIESITLNAPKYKIRLYDIMSNELIYEDSDFVDVSAHRSIQIDGIKMENNSPDPIHIIISNGGTDYIDTTIPSYSSYIDTLDTMLYDYEIEDILGHSLETGTLNYPTEKMISYTPEFVREGFISLVTQDGLGLDFTNYQVEIDSVNQYNPSFYREVDQAITIDVSDRFGNLLNSYSYTMDLVDNFISIPITQYKLKVFNDQTTDTSIRIVDNPETNEINDNLASSDVETYKLSDNLYIIEYYDEFSVFTTINVDLDSDKIIRLPTLQKDFRISLFDESGFGVSVDNVRLYYDNVRTDGFVKTFDGTHHIEVMDFFNSTLYEDDVDITAFTEFNIYLPIYTLILQNYSNETMELFIERDGIPFAVIDQQIAGNTGYQFRFAKDLEYIISWIYLNGTMALQSNLMLESNVMISSFGFSSEAGYLQITDKVSPYEYGIFIVVGASFLYLAIRLIRNRPILTEKLPKKPKGKTRR